MSRNVILASIVFWLSVFNWVISFITSTEQTLAVIWLTGSYFWLRFELALAHGVQNRAKQETTNEN